MSLSRADLDALIRRREAEAHSAAAAEVERILAIPDPTERVRAYAELSRSLEPDECIPAAAERRIVRSFTSEAEPVRERSGEAMAASTWEVERRRLALMHTVQTLAPAGIFLAALLPFVVSACRGGLGFSDALTAFLTPGAPLIGVAVAAVGVGVLARLVDRAKSLDGLAGLLVAALMAGVAGLAVALGRVF